MGSGLAVRDRPPTGSRMLHSRPGPLQHVAAARGDHRCVVAADTVELVPKMFADLLDVFGSEYQPGGRSRSSSVCRTHGGAG
jgi:hypothetical protein